MRPAQRVRAATAPTADGPDRIHADSRISSNNLDDLEKPAKASPATLERFLRSGRLGFIRRDAFLKVDTIHLNGQDILLDQEEITRLIVQAEGAGLERIRRRQFEDALRLVAKDNSYDSAQDWLSQLPPWDGVPRVERFLVDYLGSPDCAYSVAVGRYIWTGLVARILVPGCKADMVPILVGQQGALKSSLLSIIAPSEDLRGEACLTDRSTRLAQRVLGKVLVVWEELRGIRGRCDFDEVKAFISSNYIETPSKTNHIMDRHQRRFLIIGTSNRDDFLKDPTGHRRFLPFQVSRMDMQKVKQDKLQLWAEASHIVKRRQAQGETEVDYKEAEELAVAEHAAFQEPARWADSEQLITWLKRNRPRFSTTEALLAIGYSEADLTKRDRNDMAKTLRALGYVDKPAKVSGYKNPQKRWFTL